MVLPDVFKADFDTETKSRKKNGENNQREENAFSNYLDKL